LPTDAIAVRLRAAPVPAASIAVAQGFELVDAETWGTRDADTGASAGEHTLFQAGSVSQSVAALTALVVAAEGALDLDDPRDLPGGRASLRQLLSHSAGVNIESFPGYPAGLPVPSVAHVREGRSPAVTPPIRVDSAPGRFRYSGGGYLLVQELLEQRTGRPFPDLAREHVLEPLGMADSTFDHHPPEGASGHRNGTAVEGGRHLYPEAAATGLWTTASDLLRLSLALTAAAAGQPSPLSQEAPQLVLTPHVELPDSDEWTFMRELGIQTPTHMGLGLFLLLSGDERRFSHVGGAAGFLSVLAGSPADGAAIAVMTNCNDHGFLFEALLTLGAEHGQTIF
jgi:CubicO group peptidase (beta-lactamase class C family)